MAPFLFLKLTAYRLSFTVKDYITICLSGEKYFDYFCNKRCKTLNYFHKNFTFA